MPAEKATGIVVRTTDWSETSRIATIWTRELGKVSVLAKGGRRLKSNFEVALDLLTVCGIVLLRKSSGGLDLLTEAQVVERFAGLRTNLPALYAGYYIAELLGEGTQDYDPHPKLFDSSLDTLRKLSAGGDPSALVAGYELEWLAELGLKPILDRCAHCGTQRLDTGMIAMSPMAGGVVCGPCGKEFNDRRTVSMDGLVCLNELVMGEHPAVGREVREVLGFYISSVLGRRPRMLNFIAVG
ncbi:DNA repair protein RecO [Zavarzinella formosa]|uniref:DNA repair protein RecO n=1 Tax=Zavarzinella formosa TaxID=360055 RepID=UPI0002D8D507|nr:DNA repair protein RecO [Zavarzinella formosa]